MSGYYWEDTLRRRISRRRAIVGSAGITAGAAFIAACGGGDGDSPAAPTGMTGATPAAAGLIARPEDTTSRATRGGTLRWFAPAEPANLDMFADQVAKNVHKNMGYAHYVIEKPGYLEPPSFDEFVGDMMESWEWSGDGLQLTFKLRPNVKFHNKPPVNGRTLDVEDVLYSWERWAEVGTDRRFLSNAANPNAPVLSVTAPDNQTIVFRLAEPIVFLLAALSPIQSGKPSIIPKEVESGFDWRTEMIGTGPFMLETWEPTVRFEYKRHPEYYDPTYPLIDTIEMPIVPEYSSALAQVQAGRIHTYSTGNAVVAAEDILPLKRDHPEMLIYPFEDAGFTVGQLTFGWLPTEVNQPFKDERVRRAVSLSWDNDAYIEAFGNLAQFEAEGMPMETWWNSHLRSGSGSWWLDPRSERFGSSARWFDYDPAEARRLLEAAGYGGGISVQSLYNAGPQFGGDYATRVGVTDEFASEVGFRVTREGIDYTAGYVPVIRDSFGRFEGWGYRLGGSPANDAVAYLITLYHSTRGQQFLGFDAAGTGDGSGDPEIDSLLESALSEMDTERRLQLVYDVQRRLADMMYMVPHPPGSATRFLATWPAVQNFQVYDGDRRQQPFHWWIDQTQPPQA